jgi:predicted O-linked N-acetylglucosamine transferase (SPINDLY family)
VDKTAPLLQEALALYRRGALAEAAEQYRMVLRGEPRNADALYYLAQVSCREGRLAEGVEFARRVLAVDPRREGAHLLLGMALAQVGQPQEALASLDAAIACQPELADAHGNRGDVLVALGRQTEAVESYDRAIAIQPQALENWFNRAAALVELGRHDEVLASYDRVIALDEKVPQAHLGRGNALFQLGRRREALAAYDCVLALTPDDLQAASNRGNALRCLAAHDEALACFRKVLAVAPDHVHALMGQGISLIELGRREEALASFEALLAADPGNVDALNNRGFLLNALSRRDEALASYDQALRIDPGHAEALNNRGVALAELGRHAEAVASYDRAIAVAPDHVGALCNRAKALGMLQRHGEALASVDGALAIDPDHADSLLTRGNLLVKLDRAEEAIACHERVLALDPQHPNAAGALASLYLSICDWKKVARIVGELSPRLADGRSIISPITLLQLPIGPAELLTWTRRYVEHEIPTVQPLAPVRPALRPGKIRLAYLSGDFRRHPLSYVLVELIERHDRSRFEVFGISFGPDDRSDIRARIAGAFDRFHDVRSLGDGDVARLVRESGADLAIDLSGHTEFSRMGIFAYRPAPIQVNYLGIAGTTGADFIDYVVADPVCVPFDQQPYYTERIVHLPDCLLPNDATKPISPHTPSRAQAGLPERGFVFCCFNNSNKMSLAVFELWMRLLAKVEGSVLWLSQMNARATGSLRDTAAGRGIDPRRLVFAPKLAGMPDHLARQRVADLFLDTLPFNAHSTASDALWAGLPIVTCAGDTFAGRVAASLLTAAGLPELVTTSLDEYEALAFRLATEPARLSPIRQKLARNRLITPVFDTDRLRRHLETAYARMHDIWQRGETPQSFSVSAKEP